MKFEELVKIFENEESFIEKYDDGENFKRCNNIPGGPVLYGHQELKVDNDISICVECHGTGWDNTLVVVPKSKKNKSGSYRI